MIGVLSVIEAALFLLGGFFLGFAARDVQVAWRTHRQGNAVPPLKREPPLLKTINVKREQEWRLN